jgi:hypothetical protein
MNEQHHPAPQEPQASSGRGGEPTRLHSRRGLVLGAAAAGAGAAAALVAGGGPAEAANNNPVELGVSGNSATATTGITTTAGNGLEATTSQAGWSGVAGIDASSASGGGHGVYGRSAEGIGVYGTITGGTAGQSAVYGNDATSGDDSDGVHGITGAPSGYVLSISSGVTGDSEDGYAVAGLSLNSTAAAFQTFAAGESGVAGYDVSATGGYGLFGYSDNGTGVYGAGDSVGVAAVSAGTALSVDGVASFSRSGLATVAGTASTAKSSVVVKGVSLSAASMILATPQGKVSGVAVEGVVPDVSAGSFTIYLTKSVKVSLPIAWFIIDLPASGGPIAGPARAPRPKITVTRARRQEIPQRRSRPGKTKRRSPLT